MSEARALIALSLFAATFDVKAATDPHGLLCVRRTVPLSCLPIRAFLLISAVFIQPMLFHVLAQPLSLNTHAHLPSVFSCAWSMFIFSQRSICPRFSSGLFSGLSVLSCHHLACPAQLPSPRIHIVHSAWFPPSLHAPVPRCTIALTPALHPSPLLCLICCVNPFPVCYCRRPPSSGVGAACLARDAMLRLKYRLYFIHASVALLALSAAVLRMSELSHAATPSPHAHTPCTVSPYARTLS